MILLLALSLTLQQPLVVAQHQTKKAPAKPAPTRPAEPPADDFELLPKAPAPDLAAQAHLEEKLKLRRTMLNAHQLAGFTTLAALTGTVVLGQLDYLDKYGGHGDTGRFHVWHRWVAFSSAAIFAGTASLAVFAPTPIPKQAQGLDRSTLHKVAMSVASAGMLAQIVLGIVTTSSEGALAQRNYALAHQIVGYTTLAATYTGFGFFTF